MDRCKNIRQLFLGDKKTQQFTKVFLTTKIGKFKKISLNFVKINLHFFFWAVEVTTLQGNAKKKGHYPPFTPIDTPG